MPFIIPSSHSFLQTSSRRCSGTKIHLPPASPLNQVFRLRPRTPQTFRSTPASRALPFPLLPFSTALALDFRRATNRPPATIQGSPHPPRVSSRQRRTLPISCQLRSMTFKMPPRFSPLVLVTMFTGRVGRRISRRPLLSATCKLESDSLQRAYQLNASKQRRSLFFFPPPCWQALSRAHFYGLNRLTTDAPELPIARHHPRNLCRRKSLYRSCSPNPSSRKIYGAGYV